MKKMNNKGFSLVELIVVIAIMAILVGALAPQFIKYVEKSRQSTDMQSVSEMKSSVEVYCADEAVTGSYTITKSGDYVTMDSSAATNAGVSPAVKLSSSGWPNFTYVYNTANYQWSGAGVTNSKAPANNMGTVFSK